MIAGVATETIVVSTRIMKNPRHSANRAGHGLTSSAAFAVGVSCTVSAMVRVNTPAPTAIPGPI